LPADRRPIKPTQIGSGVHNPEIVAPILYL
jgi:hypothetical protein